MSSLKVYLDSANWFDLADGKVSQEKFKTGVKNGLIVPVLSFIHVLEFGNREEPYRSRVTAYVDAINAITPILWIRGLPAVVKSEVENILLSSMGISPVPINPFLEHLVDSLEAKIPWFERAEARTYSISRIVQESVSTDSRSRYQSFRTSSPMFDIQSLRALKQRNSHHPLVPDVPEYAADYLGKRVTTPSGLTIEVTPENRERFKRNFSLSTCPALSAKLTFFEGWSLSSGGEAPSMFEDLFHLVALAYCDVVFVDGQTWEALKKGKMLKLPLAHRDFKGWLEKSSV